MMFQITGGTPEEAQAQGRALIEALGHPARRLRRDEQERRASIVRDNLKIYQANLDAARERILEFQRETGLLSLNQFNEASSSAELMRRKLAENRARSRRLSAEQSRLVARLGFEPRRPRRGLRLAADPGVRAARDGLCRSRRWRCTRTAACYGPKHPARVLARAKGESAYAELLRIARASANRSVDRPAQPGADDELVASVRAVADDRRRTRPSLNGRRTEVEVDRERTGALEAEIGRMGAHAARLEALQEGSSRRRGGVSHRRWRGSIRTGRISIRPIRWCRCWPSRTCPKTAASRGSAMRSAAGILGTLIVLLAWGAAWIGASFSRKRSKSA